MSHINFRDSIPVWVRYAVLIDPRSDKYYEVRVDITDQGGFAVTKRWGRRPDLGIGQTLQEIWPTSQAARAAANAIFAQKITRGYCVSERPEAVTSGLVRESWGEDDEA